MIRIGTCVTALAIFVAGATAQKSEDTGSALTEKEAKEFLDYHNKVRKDVGIEPLKWSPVIAKYAQAWADHLAESGEFKHRPSDGERKQKYGENIAIDGSALKGAEAWYAEIKDYTAGIAIPEDISEFKAGHYTQMVWKKTKEIGAGSAIVKNGEYKGLVLTVCNYDPPGNFVGEKPY